MRTSAPNFRPGWATYLSHFTHYPDIIALDMELAAVAPIAGYDQYKWQLEGLIVDMSDYRSPAPDPMFSDFKTLDKFTVSSE